MLSSCCLIGLSLMLFENGRSFLKDKLLGGPLEGHNPRTNATAKPQGHLDYSTLHLRACVAQQRVRLLSWEHRDTVSSSNLANNSMCGLRGKAHTPSHFLVGIINKSFWLPRVVRIRKNSKGKALCLFRMLMHPQDPESVWDRESGE